MIFRRKSREMSVRRRGFSLIEMVIVIAIIVILSVVTIVALSGKKNSNDLSSAVSQAVALLNEAQSRSVSQANDVSWGVHFANPTNTAPFYALFSSAYSSTSTLGFYRLPSDVGYATATLPLGSSTNVIFNQISGLPVAPISVGFLSLSQRTLTSTISVSAAGVIMN